MFVNLVVLEENNSGEYSRISVVIKSGLNGGSRALYQFIITALNAHRESVIPRFLSTRLTCVWMTKNWCQVHRASTRQFLPIILSKYLCSKKIGYVQVPPYLFALNSHFPLLCQFSSLRVFRRDLWFFWVNGLKNFKLGVIQ